MDNEINNEWENINIQEEDENNKPIIKKKIKNKKYIENINDRKEYFYAFDDKYSDSIYNITQKFKKYVKKNDLNIFNVYLLDDGIYDFIKYNSVNYDKIIKKIDLEENEIDDIEYESD